MNVLGGLLCVVLFAVTSCSQAPQPPSAAQRFDQLRLPFRSLTRQSELVAADVGHLHRFMQRGDVAGARRAAVRLKQDGRALARHAGLIGNRVRTLTSLEGEQRLREYFRLTGQTLTWQWYEGTALAKLADVVWADPLVTTVGAEQELRTTSGKARWYAYRASVDASQASRWLRRFGHSFRYVIRSKAGSSK